MLPQVMDKMCHSAAGLHEQGMKKKHPPRLQCLYKYHVDSKIVELMYACIHMPHPR